MKLIIRENLKLLKPILKGSILTLIGLYITHQGIGIGRFSMNFLYGFLAYLLFGLSGVLIIKLLQVEVKSSSNDPTTILQIKILSLAMFIGGTLITVGYVIIYNLNILIIISIACIGVVWLSLYLYALKKRQSNLVIKIMFSLVFSMGLIYGAMLNYFVMPLYIYVFFSAVSFSQFSREINKDYISGKRNQIVPSNTDAKSLDESLRLSLVFQTLTILCLILALIAGLTYPILYLYLLILPLILLGLALYLTYKSRKEGKIYEKANTFLKFGILFELIAILLSN